ncbi:GNAT family N-acetyltransferase [Magnetococcus sp. PR-3]|uniref:GNAT family N-acetyltransferase n=1 Tax=Magnetococcus sp. PR-3 TaxID=3120355 RepID=UPI002FCE15FB
MKPPYTLHPYAPTLAAYQMLFQAVGWPVLEPSIMQRAIDGSVYFVHVQVQGQTIACGRLVGDGALYNYLQDVIVHPDYQGMGVGQQIVKTLLSWLNTHTPNRFIGLIAAEGKAEFYKQFGFLLRDAQSPAMSRRADHT